MKVQFKKDDISNQWLVDMAKDMNEKLPGKVEFKNDSVIFSENIATGSCVHHQLSENIDLAIFDLTFKTPVWVERTPTEDCNYYIMHINCSPSIISHFSNGNRSEIGGPQMSTIFWSASDISSSFKIESGQNFVAIIVCMKKEFLQKAIWNNTSPSESCSVRDKSTNSCLLIADGTHTCGFNNNTASKCMIDQKNIILRRYQTGLGRLNYELVQEILEYDKNSFIPEGLLLKANILKILAHFVKRITNKNKGVKATIHFDTTLKILEIKKMIDDRAGSDHISLTELAKTAAISKTKLKLKFKEIVGETVYQYYLKVKMEKAKTILEDNPVPISNLAYEMGFNSTSHFSQVFKKYHGVSPRAINSQNQEMTSSMVID